MATTGVWTERCDMVLRLAVTGVALALVFVAMGWQEQVTGLGGESGGGAAGSGVTGAGAVGGGGESGVGSVVEQAASASERVGRPAVCEGWVALTFDDGPLDGRGGAAELLHELDRWGVPATFFMVGQEMVQRPELVREVLADGHGVGSHGWTHSDLVGMDQGEIREELRRTSEAYAEIVGAGAGARELTLWRAPYGSVDPAVVVAGEREGAVLAMWTADPKDFESVVAGEAGVEEIVERAGGMGDGGNVLLHEGQVNTVQSIEGIVQHYWARGLCFGLLEAGGRERWQPESPALRFRVQAVHPDRVR